MAEAFALSGSIGLAVPPGEIRFVDRTGRLPDRQVMMGQQHLRVGDQLWTVADRPDGSRSLTVVDEDQVRLVVVDPCSLRGELFVVGDEVWEAWLDGPRLKATRVRLVR